MRILIYGAGVIGSLYAAILSEAGEEVSVYARGSRLSTLEENGLNYKRNGEIRTAAVTVLSNLLPEDNYDFILLTVREYQLHAALEELRKNSSPTIVTMVNSLEPYSVWEEICGEGRILPAFPGAGGGFDGTVLDADLTSRVIQPTTIGKTDGREKILRKLFQKANIPCQIVENMYVWQVCHLAMVVPIADAYYESKHPKHAGKSRKLMKNTAIQIRENFRRVRIMGMRLSPAKMKVFLICPPSIAATILGFVFRSRFGDRFMYQHSMKAPDEMRRLHEQLYDYIGERR